jgi:hypothetical protein
LGVFKLKIQKGHPKLQLKIQMGFIWKFNYIYIFQNRKKRAEIKKGEEKLLSIVLTNKIWN